MESLNNFYFQLITKPNIGNDILLSKYLPNMENESLVFFNKPNTTYMDHTKKPVCARV